MELEDCRRSVQALAVRPLDAALEEARIPAVALVLASSCMNMDPAGRALAGLAVWHVVEWGLTPALGDWYWTLGSLTGIGHCSSADMVALCLGKAGQRCLRCRNCGRALACLAVDLKKGRHPFVVARLGHLEQQGDLFQHQQAKRAVFC